MRYHLSRRRKFSAAETRFIVSCLVLGLEYMHSQGVMHKDLKPENVVMDENGYVRITDMGVAKVHKPENGA